MKTKQGLQIAEILFDKSYGDVSEYKAEIERLKADNEALTMWDEAYTEENEKLKAKNKVLKDGIVKAFTNGFNTGREQVEKEIRRAKINMLNEVKARCVETFVGKRIISAVDIDKIIEEVENDEEDRPHSQTLVESLNAETKELMLSLYCKQMQCAVEQQYLEDAHMAADSVLCELLTLLGYDKVVEIYNTLPKMYS